MYDSTANAVKTLGSGLVGITALQVTEDQSSTIMKIMIAIVSILPSIFSLFKKKKQTV